LFVKIEFLSWFRQAQVKCDAVRTLHRKEQDENRRLKLWLAQRDSQHIHETRRLENELSRLKAKLNHLLVTDARKRGQRDGFKIELANPLARAVDGKRLTWKTEAAVQKHERDLLNFAKEKLDQRLATLVGENVQLRDTVCQVHGVLADAGLLPESTALNPGSFQVRRLSLTN
jgi:hypothetical protein